MENSEKISALHPLEIKVILAFSDNENETCSFTDIEKKSGLSEAHVRRAVEWLLTKNILISHPEKTITRQSVSLTDVGREYARKKIPELRILDDAKAGITMRELQGGGTLSPEEIGPAIGVLKKHKLLRFGPGGKLEVDPQGNRTPLENIQALVERFSQAGEVPRETLSSEEWAELEKLSRKRGKAKGIFRIRDTAIKFYSLTDEGRALLERIRKENPAGNVVSRLEPRHLKDGAWRKIAFRRYSLDIDPPVQIVGKKNPYRRFLDFCKQTLLSLGFEEMTGDHVEPEFWNMDALFMPQFHSARDIHDVYFVKNPTHARKIEEPYFSRVAEAHTNGGETGSTGWGYAFDKERSRQLVLRSQGTVLSARWLHKARVPGKYFAMARCFRYDSVDPTHAPDFFQIEGIVLAKENTFKTLLGLLKLFATEVAKAEEIKFLPAYFPFTEPSVEAHIKHPKLGWMEMGGAGIFRPEVTKPQGVDVPVIAWGLGLDRMAMVAMGIDDIRELFTTDLNRIRSSRMIVSA